MLTLEDPRWRTLHSGYRLPYDPTPILRRLASRWDDQPAWNELWGELHHQGDVGEASYAALVAIADLARNVASRGWNAYALAATVESQRHARRNPPLPGWLAADYRDAWSALTELALADLSATQDPLVVRSALAVVALGKGLTKLGTLIADLDESELDEYLDQHFDWSAQYRTDLPPPAAE